MLTFYRKTYRRAPKGAERLNPFEIGILYPEADRPTNGQAGGPADGTDAAAGRPAANGGRGSVTDVPERPATLPLQPSGPMASTTDSPGAGGATAAVPAATASDDKARRRAESQQRAALMAKLPTEVKLRVAKKEIDLATALAAAGIDVPDWARTGASAPPAAPVARGDVEISATGADPMTERKATELDAQKGEAAAEGRNLVGGTIGGDPQPVAPRTAHDAAPASVSADPKEAKRAEAQRRLALMQRLPSELKLRVARRDVSLEDALREAGVDPSELG